MIQLRSLAVLLIIVVPVAAQGPAWHVGDGGDLDWSSQALIAAAVEFDGQVLQPRGLTPTDNIVASLSWIDVGGTPADLSGEGQARVWSNVAGKGPNQDLVMVDGNARTGTGSYYKANNVRQTGRTFTFDLGASFPAHQLVFYPSEEGQSDFVRAYEIRVNDGLDFDREGRPNYVLLRRDDLNRQPRVQIDFPLQLLRFVELRIIAPNPFEIAEIEVYGDGFVPRARYESAFIHFDGNVNLGRMTVEAERRSGDAGEAEALLQVRNGLDETPLVYFSVDPETQNETEIDLAEYNRLDEQRRTVRYDSRNWSPWSEPLRMTADGTYELALNSLPGSRPFFQFALTFNGTAADVMRVRSLRFTYSSPLASSAVAEVALLDDPRPEDGVVATPTGQSQRFLYAVGARVGVTDPGFDGVRIRTVAASRFLSLAFGRPEDVVTPDSVRIDGEGLSVFFPSRRVGAGDSVSVWIGFETSPLYYSTRFDGWLLDSTGAVDQPLAAGNVGAQISSDGLIVFGSLDQPLQRFRLEGAAVVTPNGDGKGDRLQVSYDLVYLVEPATVELTIRDLTGRILRRLVDAQRPAGHHIESWNGTDEAGRPVAPGHYLCSLHVHTQRRSFQRLLLLAVAY